MKLNEHFKDIAESYLFSDIAHRVNAYTAANPDKKVLRLGIGDVTLPLAPSVIAALHGAVEEMAHKETFRGYGPEQGYAFLKDSINEHYKRKGVELDSDEIFISDGAKSDLGNILDIFAKDNVVLVPDPVYPVYVDTNTMAGRKIIYMDATAENGFLPMPDYSVDADIIYLCSPNNPTGAAYSKAQLKEWVDYANKKGAVILYDAAYECFITDESLARSIYQVEGAKTCAIEFCSFSKTAGFTGTRCGYTVVPKAIEADGLNANKMWLRRQTTKFNGVPYIVQRGAAAVFTEQGEKEIKANIAVYQTNAKIIADCMDELGIWYTGGKNSPYIWLKCPKGMGSWEFFDYLLNGAQVVGTPGAGFGKNGEGFFRLTAFGSREVTEQAVARIKKLLTESSAMEVSERTKGAGILCHISSLPGEYGIGTLGREAYEFVDLLAKCGAKYWQILPLQQTGYGDSPYQSVCCLSGNPYFIDLVDLKKRGLIDGEELEGAKRPSGKVDYGELYESRYALLRRAYARFNIKDKNFVAFIESGEFEDYALFMSLKSRYGGTFTSFPDAFKYKEPLAIYEFRNSVYRSEYCFWLFLQYIFKQQWHALKTYANGKGIKIIGDIPLYVAADSSDLWSRPELFQLDEDLKPTKVAGVPPDYFSKKGQLWGNPLYNWNAMRAENYDWWVNRIAKASEMYDVVRIDHFRGLDRYYAVPAGAYNAVEGEWEKGPGMELFDAVRERLGDIDIIAEDLGVLDDGVLKLRENSGLPGMKILMFAFDGNEDNDYLPCNIPENSVTYTGTHDNDTALGFLYKMTDEQFRDFKKCLRKVIKGQGLYMPIVDREDAVKALCLSALNTKSYLVVLPVQDILRLDNTARMNTPAVASGNWTFRLEKQPDRRTMAALKRMIINSGR